jgi:hypothetical protein
VNPRRTLTLLASPRAANHPSAPSARPGTCARRRPVAPVPRHCPSRGHRAGRGPARGCSQRGRRRAGRAGFVIPIAGAASFAEADSPFDKVAGLGFAGVPDAAALQEIEQAFAVRGAGTQVELAHLAAPAPAPCSPAAATGSSRSRMCRPGRARRSRAEHPAGDRSPAQRRRGVRVLARRPDRRHCPPRQARTTLARGVSRAGHRGPSPIARRPASRATRRGHGGRRQRAHHRRHRAVHRRGHHARASPPRHSGRAAPGPVRLADAAAAGCDVAVVTTQPASKSHQNVQRQGFDLLYAGAIMARHP